MPALLTLVVAYVGIGGPHASKVDAQVHALLDRSGDVVDTSLKKADRHTLVQHGARAKTIIARIDRASVVAGELDKKGKKLTVVVYGNDGVLVDLVELPVHKHKLSKSDLASLRDTLIPDIERLDEPPPPPDEPVAQESDDESPTETAAADESDDAPVLVATTAPVKPHHAHAPRFTMSVGAGPMTRTFEPGPSMVEGYRSTAVPAARVDARFAPIRFASLDADVERTLTMSSALDSGNAATSIFHWQGTAALRLPLGPIELAALGGLGSRDFVISAPAPTPDGHYIYAVAGGRLAVHLGPVEVRGQAAYQPVIGGPENIQMTSGPAKRVAIDVGGALEVAAGRHLLVTAAADWQRFTWTWAEGSATDVYPSASLSLGARY